MDIITFKSLLKEKEIEFIEVFSYEELKKKQDSYILEDSYIVGIHLKNIDLEDIEDEILKINSLKYLVFNNVNLDLSKFLSNQINLLSLDLSGNELDELPKVLFNLKNLKRLNLSGNELKKLSKELFNLENLESLNLSDNELSELPKEILNLKKIYNLDLSSNEFEELPKELFELKNLQNLDLSSNDLTEFPKELFELKNLQNLDLNGNGLKDFPKELFNLTNLQSINLSFMRLKKLPKELCNLENLQSLNLSYNGLKELPKELFNLKNLQNLNLSYNGLEKLPKELFHLKNLQSLDLSGNKLTDLPKELFDLKNLQNLSLRGSGLKELPKELFSLKNLQSLDLCYSELKELPKELFSLKNLQSLELRGNGLKQLPKELFNLKNLQSLDLSGNELTELPKELFNLSRLSILSLSNIFDDMEDKKQNKIKSIPDEFINLKVLKYFTINEKYLETFYKTAYVNGLTSLKNSIKQKIEQGTTQLYEAKLLFVGEPGAGKTSLMEKIIDKDYVLKDKTNEVSTLGIDIKKYEFNHNSQHFRANLWDFGGQQIQYMSHQFFLTPNSLYVLVGDDRKQHTDFDYWFHIINLLSDNSPILVTLNEINHHSITNFDLKAYKERFNSHKIELENLDLSNMSDGRYEKVKQKVESMLFNLPHIGDELPARWIDIREEINKISERDYYISYNTFKQMCNKYNLSDIDAKTLSKHFHNIGIFLHYIDDINGLSETIFLNPKWVMDGIYTVLADKSVNDNNGKFTKEWLFEFWEKHPNKYCDEIKNRLLTLMLKDKFEICYKLDNENSYISPQLLPSSLTYEYKWDYTNNLFYRFQYPFMPKGIVSRLIVRLNDLIYSENNIELIWKKGAVFKDKNAKAQIIEKETPEGLKVIDIAIFGEKFDALNLLSKVKNEIEHIHKKSFPHITFEEMIPCICEECLKEKPHYYKLSYLQHFALKGKESVTCEKSVEDVLISDLIGNITIKNVKSNELEFLEYAKGINVIINNNNSSNSSTNITGSMNMSQTQNVEITISQSVNSIISGLGSLSRKVEDEKKKEEIKELQEEFKDLGENPTKKEITESGLMDDLKDLVDEFDEKVKDTNKVIGYTERAINSAKSLGKTYNDLANLCGLPTVPSFLLKD